MHLCDYKHAVCIRRMDDIAWIDQPQTDPAIYGRSDSAIGQLEFGAGDLRLVRLNRAVILADGSLLRIQLLARDDSFLPKRLITREVGSRIFLRRRIFRKLAFGLR